MTPYLRPGGKILDGDDRERQVRRIFSEIAPRYDLLNHVLSLNIDRRWRRAAVDALAIDHGGRETCILDACAGTYDLSLELSSRSGFQGWVAASDFAYPMLSEGKGKLADDRVRPVCGDSLRLPFATESFHGAMVAFGIRNLADVDRGFRELHRVLRPGGRLVILEFTTPPSVVLRHFYLFYFHRVLPLIGRVVSGHPWAYTYLPESVREFPGPSELAVKLSHAGFNGVEWRHLTGGIAAIHLARKVD